MGLTEKDLLQDTRGTAQIQTLTGQNKTQSGLFLTREGFLFNLVATTVLLGPAPGSLLNLSSGLSAPRQEFLYTDFSKAVDLSIQTCLLLDRAFWTPILEPYEGKRKNPEIRRSGDTQG